MGRKGDIERLGLRGTWNGVGDFRRRKNLKAESVIMALGGGYPRSFLQRLRRGRCELRGGTLN